MTTQQPDHRAPETSTEQSAERPSRASTAGSARSEPDRPPRRDVRRQVILPLLVTFGGVVVAGMLVAYAIIRMRMSDLG